MESQSLEYGQPQQGVEQWQWLVVCLCAQWCGVCQQYQNGFEALAASHPQARFLWLDVEDREDAITQGLRWRRHCLGRWPGRLQRYQKARQNR